MNVKNAVHEAFSDARAKLREFKGEFTKRNFLIALFMCFHLLPLVMAPFVMVFAVFWASAVLLVISYVLCLPVFLIWFVFWRAVFRKIGGGSADKGIDLLVDAYLKTEKGK